eukprot:TRINITY_DN20254_c0_g1_i1.p1 TRINITY_DN20254_c0_g1~~TRINITY_DN20254_c0_g1_i1.p1  ORF type:complete len:687 (-),score=177.80 TRINITY_DN20254_c0_g1_i1:162-2222(-)
MVEAEGPVDQGPAQASESTPKVTGAADSAPSATGATPEDKTANAAAPVNDSAQKTTDARKMVEPAEKKPEDSKKASSGSEHTARKAPAKQEDKPKEVVDREELTGLRLSSRCVPAAAWREEIRKQGFRLVPFSRLLDLKRIREQAFNRVVIGVLYDRPSTPSFETGECYLAWPMTDLALPQAKRIKLHLRREAYQHYRKGPPAASASRGSVFAILNPMIDQSFSEADSKKGLDIVLRVDKAQFIVKLGDCPSLGRCDMKGCQEPCNREAGDRFCIVHLHRAYAQKNARIAAGGGASIAGLVGVASAYKKGGIRPAPKQMPNVEIFEEPSKTREEKKIEAQDVKSQVTASFNERRLQVGEKNKASMSYIRSIRDGRMIDTSGEWSRIPTLGRGMGEDDELEIDMATQDTEEKDKAHRILCNRERKRELQEGGASSDELSLASAGASTSLPGIDAPALSKAKRPRTHEDGEDEFSAGRRRAPAPKRSLAELVQGLHMRRAVKKADTAAKPATAQTADRAAEQPADAQKAMPTPSADDERSTEAAAPEGAQPVVAPPCGAATALVATTEASATTDSAKPATLPEAEGAQDAKVPEGAGHCEATGKQTVVTNDFSSTATLLEKLNAALEDSDRARQVMEDIDALPLALRQGMAPEIGKLTLKCSLFPVKQLLLNARRRWRLEGDVQAAGT